MDGHRFRDVLISFPDAVPCGVKVASEGGKIILNPDDSYVLREGDELLVIAEDDDTYAPGPLPEVIEQFSIYLVLFLIEYFPTGNSIIVHFLFSYCRWCREFYNLPCAIVHYIGKGEKKNLSSGLL